MPGFGVVVAVLTKQGVDLQLREDAGLWNLPGGVVEPGESLAQAAVREVMEETGLAVRLTRLVGVYSRPRWQQGGNHQILFAATPVGGDLRQFETTETLDARFFDPATLPDRLLWWHRQMIEDAVGGVGGARAWTLDAEWPFDADRAAMAEKVKGHEDLAERMRVIFSARPTPEATHLDVGPR